MDAKTKLKLPYDGELLLSPNKKFKETIVFVHHFGGNKRTTKRHQNLVLELGFDCVTFNLFENSQGKEIDGFERVKRLILHLFKGKKTYVANWTKELNDILNSIEGSKIIFSLSSPSTSAVGVLGKLKRKDIKAWVCDGGPFVQIWSCFKNYAALETKTKNPIISYIHTTLGFIFFGGLGYNRRMTLWLKDLPKDLPILNFRAALDQLVPEKAIEGFFALNVELEPEVVRLEHSGHLEGIKTEKGLYHSKLSDFLSKHATPLDPVRNSM